MGMTTDQLKATESFEEFLRSDSICYALLGYAGTGKSWLLAKWINDYISGSITLLASPTHKAAHVMRSFLGRAGIRFGASIAEARLGIPIVGTTAQLLGIRPEVSDDQDDSNMEFRRSMAGTIERMGEVEWIIIDEISMLSQGHFDLLIRLAREHGARVLVVGDPGQLPPVKAEAINFRRIVHRGLMRQVMRTESDTGITELATRIRNNEPWRDVIGSGVRHVKNTGRVFLNQLGEPMGENERDWSVYVAYRNVCVNAVNEAACQKLYGHSRHDLRSGEIVLATNGMSRFEKGEGRVPLCTPGETLVVEQMGGRGEWGTSVYVRSVQTGERFLAEFMTESARNDMGNPFNLELKKRNALAQRLQKESKEDRSVEHDRKAAWASYFDLRDNTVLGVSHPFAITAYKSQGSTYNTAFVDADDLGPFDYRAMYVAATRPSDRLVIG